MHMQSFKQFLAESTQRDYLNEIYGDLRQEGIHAGNRLAESPLVATRGFMALATATGRVTEVLKRHGYIIQRPLDVTRLKEHITADYAVARTTDAGLTVGTFRLRGTIDPDNKGTLQFDGRLNLSPTDDSK